jgi:hypothetical protein
MTSYTAGFPSLGGVTSENLSVVELRVISNLIQQYNGGSAAQEDLRLMRNDEGQALGLTPPIPGQ